MSNKKNIKDYLHLYLGCKVKSLSGGSMLYTLTGIGRKQAMFNDGYGNEMWLAEGDYKLILRPLSDMADEEIEEISMNIFSVTPHLIEYSLVDIKDFIVNNQMFVVGAGEDEYDKAPSVCGFEFSAASFFYLTRYLLSKGFDMFGLIEAGLAIDKTKIN